MALTLPDFSGPTIQPNTGPVIYFAPPGVTVQNASMLGPLGQTPRLGSVGQVSIAGFSPVGVDVFNFPQRRVNNTYQVADELTMRAGRHAFVFYSGTLASIPIVKQLVRYGYRPHRVSGLTVYTLPEGR